jgi:heme A synthase
LQVLSIVTLLAVFGLVVLGGVVRLTDSGLGCPDWPLCHGRIIPPMNTSTLIEYSHRLMASVVGVLVVLTALGVWRFYRRYPWLMAPACIAVLLLVVQVLLGGFTVLQELPGEIVMAHLATAEALLAVLVVLCLGAMGRLGAVVGRVDLRLSLLAAAALVMAYAVLLTGSYVTVSGSTAACGTAWPLCDGAFLSGSHHAAMHMVHRLAGLIAAVLMALTLVGAWKRRERDGWLGRLSLAVAAGFGVQIFVGAAIMFTGFDLASRLAHLAIASLVWLGLSAVVVLLWAPRSPRLRGAGGA